MQSKEKEATSKLSNFELISEIPKEPRKIPRVQNFNIDFKECEPGETGYIKGKQWKILDNGYLTIKSKLGVGGFCKVKRAECTINRVSDEQTGQKETYI